MPRNGEMTSRERVLVSVTPEMKELLEEEAKLHHWSLSQTIYLILKDWLDLEDNHEHQVVPRKKLGRDGSG